MVFNFEPPTPEPEGGVGRRERKKLEARVAVLAAARRLMEADGYDETSMAAVAEAADVSVGSVYNYFGNKQALLLGVVSEAARGLLEAGEAVLREPGNDAVAALSALMRAYVEALASLGKTLLKRALGVSFTEAPEMSSELISLDHLMVRQLEELISVFRDRGAITQELSAQEAAFTLYGTLCTAIMMWVMLPDEDIAGLIEILDRQLRVVFRGLEPRRKTRRKR